MCYNKYVKGRRSPQTNACHCECSTGVGSFEKKVSRKCRKPLDKLNKVCYNKYTEMREGNPKKRATPTRVSKTFPTKTSHRKVATRLRYINVNQTPPIRYRIEVRDYPW